MPPISSATMTRVGDGLPSFVPQHCLYFFPLPHVHGLFRLVFMMNSFLFKDVEQMALQRAGYPGLLNRFERSYHDS